jgi:hypothetical protein
MKTIMAVIYGHARPDIARPLSMPFDRDVARSLPSRGGCRVLAQKQKELVGRDREFPPAQLALVSDQSHTLLPFGFGQSEPLLAQGERR